MIPASIQLKSMVIISSIKAAKVGPPIFRTLDFSKFPIFRPNSCLPWKKFIRNSPSISRTRTKFLKYYSVAFIWMVQVSDSKGRTTFDYTVNSTKESTVLLSAIYLNGHSLLLLCVWGGSNFRVLSKILKCDHSNESLKLYKSAMVFLFAFPVVVKQDLVNHDQAWFRATLDFSNSRFFEPSLGGSKNRDSTVIYWDSQIEGEKCVRLLNWEQWAIRENLERKQNVSLHGRF